MSSLHDKTNHNHLLLWTWVEQAMRDDAVIVIMVLDWHWRWCEAVYVHAGILVQSCK